MDLREKVLLVTGASGTLGVAVTRLAAQTGARLALTARQTPPLESQARELLLPPDRTLILAADLALPEDVAALVERVDSEWGGFDVLLNATGGWSGGSRVAEMAVQDWDAMLALNLRTAFLTCRAVLPHMIERGWGRIVNIASRAALEPAAKQAAYNVSKAGVLALTASIAQDYKRKGITANTILPSVIDSPAARQAQPDADHSRWVKPDDIARMMLYLCGEETGSINGASIAMYGGL
jgi:NAD(P)-dependent dehydrogenase (short-subunit alcohol dehydrogenase family)